MFKTNIKIIFTITILTIFSLSDLNTVSAAPIFWSSTAKSMDKFKDEQYKNIFDWDNILLGDENLNFYEWLNKNEQYEKIREKIVDSKNLLVDQKDVLTTRKQNLEETIKQLDDEISKSTEDISSLNREVLKLTQEIEDLKVQVSEIQKEIDENKKVLLEYIAHIYKKSNIVFNSWEVDSLKTILLNSWNLSDILNDLHFSSIIEITGQTLIEKHRKLIRQLFVKKMEMESKTDDLKNSRREEVIKRKSILEKKNFREKILAYTNWQEWLFDEFIKNKEDSDKKVQIKILQNKIVIKEQKELLLKKYNCEYLDLDSTQLKYIYLLNNDNNLEWNTCLELNQILQNESKLKPLSTNTVNVLQWPIIPKNWISSYFKDPEYEKEVWTTHEAVDIRATQGTDIMAPADGYVTFLREPNDEWYAYVVLKHADGFVTVYGHVSEVFVKKYDFVRAWEVFAKSWWEFWTNGAWVTTTWPHLHFEVYKDKEYVDPLNYLDLTVLWEENIPKNQKYVYKYMDDFKEKNWVVYEWALQTEIRMFTLDWETEVDRQKDLLSKYAVWDFNNWNVWVEEAIDWNIDPSFVMCIWLSETGLWRNLKTPYNVWNVWNTDSWEVKDFQNARSWVYGVVRTLNNKFLWDYTKLSQLSRYWNKDGTIYASSSTNWHTNMARCLSALKEKSIPDDYNFRIGQ
jgi:murein DD-endopeptidase MepM/ murein hydrolase activator NlpD